MSNNRAGHAASIVVHRIRQNWRWSKAHSWAHLIEEHDLNPLVRGRRAIRKSWWRLTQRDQKTRASARCSWSACSGPAPTCWRTAWTSCRSSTSTTKATPRRSTTIASARCRRSKPGRQGRRQVRAVQAAVRFASHAGDCSTHFGARARAIWAYRSVDGRVRSAVAKFGDFEPARAARLRGRRRAAAVEHLADRGTVHRERRFRPEFRPRRISRRNWAPRCSGTCATRCISSWGCTSEPIPCSSTTMSSWPSPSG